MTAAARKRLGTRRIRGCIVRNPRILGGKPTIAGTRMTVEFIIELLATGMTPNDIARVYNLPREAVRAALVNAALDLRRADVVTPPRRRRTPRQRYATARG